MTPETNTPRIIAIRDPDLGFGVWPWSKGPLFLLREDWTFQFWDGKEWHELTIPEGYEFDKASIPSVFWGAPWDYLPDGLCTVPALEHDFLCDLNAGGSDWLKARLGGKLPLVPATEFVHKHLYWRLLAYGVRPRKAAAMWEVVRKFGPGSWVRPSTWFNK